MLITLKISHELHEFLVTVGHELRKNFILIRDGDPLSIRSAHNSNGHES
jgi:hypothetical protein